jgi:hypothetical protein
MLGRIEHHLDDAFNIPIGRGQSADIDAKTVCNRGTDLTTVKHFTFDFTRFEDIFGQGFENCFRPQLKAKRLHPSDEASLLVADFPKMFSEALRLPGEAGPVRTVVDVDSYSPHHMRRM